MKTKYSLGVCNLADLVYTVLLIRVLCFQRDGGLGGKGGGEIGRKGGIGR